MEENLLPSSLTNIAPQKTWISLPPMDTASIKGWLRGLHKSSEFTLSGSEDQVERTLNEISSALVSKTMGYPLHLIYAVRELLSKERRLSTYRVDEIMPCPNGDIREYYQSLWNGLGAGPRDILLLIACVQFPWPDKGNLSKCYTDVLGFQEAFSLIHHLIEQRQSGIHPFHGSLTAFLRATDNFKTMSASLMARVKNWLNGGAPEYWQWGWKWLIEASLGNPKAILEGVSKDWAVSSISQGYSIDHIDYIISQGENYALKSGLYSELVRLRSIRIRVVNGPEYQIQDYPLFLKCALTLQNDDYPYLLKLDNLRYLPDEELPIISSLSKASADDVCKLCFFEVRRRIYLAIELKDDRIKNLIDIGLSILSHMPTPDYDILSNFFGYLRDPQDYIVRYFKKLLENGNAETVIEVASYDFANGFSGETKELVTWACLIAGINLQDRSDLPQLKNSKVAQIYNALTAPKTSVDITLPPESEKNRLNYHDYFFFEFCRELSFETETVELVGIPRRDANAFNFAVKTALKYLAQTVAQEINAKGSFSSVSFFQTWDAIDIPSWHESDHTIYDQITSLGRNINEISVDLFILSHRTKVAEEFTDSTIDELLEISAFSSQLWLSHLSSKFCQELLTTSTATHWFDKLYSELRERNDNIGILANDTLDLCDLACRFHCDSEARKLLELTCLHILGHGSRKDITFHDLYQAIEHCAEAGVGNLPDWLRRLSAPTNGAFEFTEKEIAHLPAWYFNLTGHSAFERLPYELEYHLDQQNWNNVDHILVSFVKFTDASSRADNALLKCLVSRKPILELEKRASNSPEFKRIYDEQIEFLGGLSSDNDRTYSGSSLPPQQTKLKFCDYPPERIRDFERSLKDEQDYSYDKIVSSWIKHWCAAGKALQVVSAIEEIANDFVERGWGFERNIGEVFDLSLKLQGKKTAHKWAIRDVKFNQLWSAYSGGESTQKLKKYSRIYKSKWQDFLQLTLAHEDENSRFSFWNLAPADDLVAFLIEAEQFDEATAVTEILLTGFETGVQHLKLPAEYLPVEIDKTDSVSARILFSYFFIPDKIARFKAAKEISSLLLYDDSYHYMYLEKLGTLVYESDICDFLSILSLGNSTPFSECELRSNIRYPSVLSEYILSTLGFRSQFTNQMYTEFSNADLKHSERMERSKNGIPQIWEVRLHELSQDHDLSLDLQMAAEWEVLTKRKQFLYFNHTDFINEKYYSHDEVNCSLSSNCEVAIVSAYLRTIGYCFAIGVLDNTNLIDYIMPALPFCMPLSSLNPNRRPNFWPSYKDIHSSETNLSDISLQHFLDEWSFSDEVPLFASGPIFMAERGLEADLECIIVAKDHVLDQQELEELFVHTSQPEDGLIVAKTFNWPIGRWQTDLYMRGFSVPAFKIGTQNHSTKTFGNKVVFIFDDTQIAQWSFWYEEWFPARSRGLGSHIAVVTSCVVNDLEKIANAVECDLVLALRLKVSKAHPSYNKQKNGEYFASRKIYARKEKI